MIHVEPKELSIREVYLYLVGGIGPRPIALVSTQSGDGVNNLAPYSFFNGFGANPPMVAFSATRRVRGGTLKDTYHNLLETEECVIQVVTYPIVEQVNLTSNDYPTEVDEFVKSGLTPVPSDVVKPHRVAESPFQMECKLWKMVPLGEENGAGNLFICEVVKFHVAEDILVDGAIHPDRIDLVGRQGGNFYSRASGEAVFEVPRLVSRTGRGVDQLPPFIRDSHVFTGNNLGRLAGVDEFPSREEVVKWVEELGEIDDPSREAFDRYRRRGDYRHMVRVAYTLSRNNDRRAAHFMEVAAQCAVELGEVEEAWKAALYGAYLTHGDTAFTTTTTEA